ncbi:MAG TPA: hypothetical protein VEY09_03920 [Pyrinomonadaceae bacterium]|nr:hypothetical protein [Pyrinomonadaceae bacterium]
MKSLRGLGRPTAARGELGGARLNFLIVVAVIALAAYSAYQYVPVAYAAFRYKDVMQETVNKAAFQQGSAVTWATAQLRAAAKEAGLPEETRVEVQNQSNRLVARVRWTRPVPLPGYVYHYEFDHTVASSSFFSQ